MLKTLILLSALNAYSQADCAVFKDHSEKTSIGVPHLEMEARMSESPETTEILRATAKAAERTLKLYQKTWNDHCKAKYGQ